jgi:hypothetical protein
MPEKHFFRIDYFNPGSCGPRRFQLPVTVGLLTIGEDGEFEPKIVALRAS